MRFLHKFTLNTLPQFSKGGKFMAENKYVVKVIWTRDNDIISSNTFATKKEAEEFRDLNLYAMRLNYGENQNLVKVEIEEL